MKKSIRKLNLIWLLIFFCACKYLNNSSNKRMDDSSYIAGLKQSSLNSEGARYNEIKDPKELHFLNQFQVLLEVKNKRVTNYYLLITFKNFNQKKIKDFVSKFRKIYPITSNIYIYDSKDVLPLANQYPIEGKDYLKLADHFVASSSFDTPDVVTWYPYQDILYKRYGGKHWKKNPIK